MRRARGGWICLLALIFAACGKPQAMGEPTELLVGASDEIWEVLEDEVIASLEPTTLTVRNEAIFEVAHRDPAGDEWRDLRSMRQIVLIGSAGNPAVAEVLATLDAPPPQPPTLFQAQNVWALNQSVSVVLLPPGADPLAARPLLRQLSTTLVHQLEQYAAARMFVSGANEELADSLRRNAGFTLRIPNVYRFEEREPGVFIFRNDQPDPATLIRNITVASRPVTSVTLTPAALATWREELVARLTQPPQLTGALSNSAAEPGAAYTQIEGTWTNPPDQWPAGGIFITRATTCGSREFLIDAWLYAPGQPKYEYDYQLPTILQSFRCAE